MEKGRGENRDGGGSERGENGEGGEREEEGGEVDDHCTIPTNYGIHRQLFSSKNIISNSLY